jgi:hypothetical protein
MDFPGEVVRSIKKAKMKNCRDRKAETQSQKADDGLPLQGGTFGGTHSEGVALGYYGLGLWPVKTGGVCASNQVPPNQGHQASSGKNQTDSNRKRESLRDILDAKRATQHVRAGHCQVLPTIANPI